MILLQKEKNAISMRGTIGDIEGGCTASDFSAALTELEGQDVVIELDSEGGSVTEGLAIFNAIAKHDGDVTVIIDTLAASIATVICCAASKVKMNSNAKYFVHRAWTVAAGNCRDFMSTAQLLEMMDGDIASTYASKAGIDEDEALKLMDDETWMSAQEALNYGFVDEIVEISGKHSVQNSTHLPAEGNTEMLDALVRKISNLSARVSVAKTVIHTQK